MVKTTENTTHIFDEYRILLFSIAYRMLSSATDAEDIVQEAFVRWLQASEAEVQSPKAYLSTVVVRLCIDQLRSLKAQREVYIGPWLPEPILTSRNHELTETVVLSESLSFAFLVMLERLGPLERAVFLLREVFDYDYAEIAVVVGKNEANCRQVLHRAHLHLDQHRPRFAVSAEQQERILSEFITASVNGDMQGLLNLLTDDIVLIGDGGGKAHAGLRPVSGAAKVARGMVGGLSKWLPPNVQPRIAEINGQLALAGYLDGHPYGVILLDVEGERVSRVYIILNPDKLRRLEIRNE